MTDDADPDYITLLPRLGRGGVMVALMHYSKTSHGYEPVRMSQVIKEREEALTLAYTWGRYHHLEVKP